MQTDDVEKVRSCFPTFRFHSIDWYKLGRRSYKCFISPPVQGWSFIRSEIPHNDKTDEINEIKRMLENISARVGTTVFFGSHRFSDYYCWAIAEKGKLLRGFATVDGSPYWDVGEKIGIEKYFIYPHETKNHSESFEEHWPDEEMILQIAADWSLSPATLDEFEITTPGWVAR